MTSKKRSALVSGFRVKPITKSQKNENQQKISVSLKSKKSKPQILKHQENEIDEECQLDKKENFSEFDSPLLFDEITSENDEEINSDDFITSEDEAESFSEYADEPNELSESEEDKQVKEDDIRKNWIGSGEDEEASNGDCTDQINSDLEEVEDDFGEEVDNEADTHKEQRKLILNTADEGVDDDQADDIPDLSQINSRIQASIAILSDWKGHSSQVSKTRSSYVSQLKADLCLYFGYNEFLMEKFMDLLPKPAELYSFLEANEMERPITIRCNTLKCKRKELAQALIARGVNLEPTMERWNPVGLQVFDSKVPIGATPEYLAGHYMLQAAASFLPVLAMGIPETLSSEERILDMCAAPGGKTTFIASLMKNAGCLFANDISEERIKALAANLHRMGVTNCVVTSMDGRKIGTYIKGFDRILLDAPCSGTGVISKDSSIKTGKSAEEIQNLSRLQKELILAAVDALNASDEKPGILVYSTCSVLVEENEQVIDYVLKKRPNILKLESCGVEFGEEGFTSIKGMQFDKSLKLTRRYYPHTHNLDGFFVARLVKTPPPKEPNSKKNRRMQADDTGEETVSEKEESN
jgi:25S rRNA (cytosine2870-C5)-methyltransferase